MLSALTQTRTSQGFMNMQYAARSVAHTSDIIPFFSKVKQACNPIDSTLAMNGKYNESDQPNGWNVAQHVIV